MVGRICPPGWNKVKVSENLGATEGETVSPVDTFLPYVLSNQFVFEIIFTKSAF
jgi:hypothetical protein